MADMAERYLDQLKVGMWPESGYNVYLPPEIHRQSLYALGLSGCLHPDTPIFDPVDATTKTVFQRFVEGQTFHVVALDGSNTPIIAEAEAPKQYPTTKMYRVSFDNGESITVTGDHRLFVGTGYVSVAQLLFSYEQNPSAVGIRLPSISDNDLLGSLVDAQSWRKIGASFRADCHHVFRLNDRQPQLAGDIDQVSSPLLAGVLPPGCGLSGRDGLTNRCRYSLCIYDGHSSRQDCARPENSSLCREGGCPLRERTCRQFDTFPQSAGQPLSDSFLFDTGGWLQQSGLDSRFGTDGCQCYQSADTCEALSRLSQLFSQLGIKAFPIDTALYHGGFFQNLDPVFLAYNNDYVYGIAGTTQCQIIDIIPVGESVYYDFHVPIYENY